jgi:pyruvate formate lyase activating enzyme
MGQPFIYNLQKYSIHDGNGIRTTIFFKGCPLHCAWCHNPESQNFFPELMFNEERCTGCGACVSKCSQNAVFITENGFAFTDSTKCTACGKCADCCLNGARDIAGLTYDIEELVREVDKDRMFYEQSGGGVTLSGGEVMAQPIDYIEKLTAHLFDKGYSVNIDTCGFAPFERFERILPYVDTFLYDIKDMDSERHMRYTGIGNELIIDNLRKLSGAGARIWLRLPLVEHVNADEAYIRSVIEFLKSGVILKQINLLPYHNIGKSKYSRLNRTYNDAGIFEVPPDEKMKQFAELFRENGFPCVKIGG